MLKKIYFISTFSVLLTTASFAEQKFAEHSDFSLLVGGEFGTELGARIQQNKYIQKNIGTISNNVIEKQGITANNKNLGLDSFAAGHVTLENTANLNFVYGAHMGMKTTTRSNQFSGKGSLERSYVFLEGKDWGRLEAGANEGASRAMMIKGKAFDAGECTWDKYLSFNSYTQGSNFITPAVKDSNFLTSPKLVFQETKYETNHEAFRKVTYYTPKMNGFQVGISYIPDATNKGGDSYFPNQNTAQKAEERNALSGGLTWEKELDKNHTINFSLVGERGNMSTASISSADPTQKGLFHRTEAWGIGMRYLKDKVSLATAYGNRGKSKFKKNIKDSISGNPISPASSYFFNIGGAYQLSNNLSLSLTYLHTSHNKNLLDLIYTAANYTIINGCKVYAEIAYFEGKQKRNYDAGINPTITTNQNFKINGTALITGIKFRF